MFISYSNKFKKQYKKLPNIIQNKFKERVNLFLINQNSEILRIHKLQGRLDDLYSLNVTGDVRAIFDRVSEEKIEFVAIGSHSELYT